MENDNFDLDNLDVIEQQELAKAGLKKTRKDLRRDFSQLGAELWVLAHDDRMSETERENFAAWTARITWYIGIICEVFDRASDFVDFNILLQTKIDERARDIDMDTNGSVGL